MGARASKTRKAKRSQKGGDYGFSGPAFMSAAGAPVESRMDQIDCMMVDRPAPTLQASYGGARRSRKQKGGACGCNSLRQTGGGGGTGGFSMDVMNNDLGKYSAFTPGNCATVPARAMVGGSRKNQQKQKQRRQRGGSEAYGLQSYTAGYDMNRPVEAGGGSAHYMDWSVYDKTCKGGARKGRKGSRASHKKRASRS